MTLEHVVLVDQIDIFRDGVVGVRMKKLAIRADGNVRWGYHRSTISPLVDAEEMLSAVTAHLAAMGAGSFDGDEWDRVLRTTARVHDAATAEAYAERITKAAAGEDPDAALDGAIVFSQTSLFRKTPGCPPDKIDALILARPVQILAGLDPQPLTDGALFRLLPGGDVEAERATFEAKLGAEQFPPEAQWTEIGKTAEAEHTPEVVSKFDAEVPALIARGVLAAASEGRGDGPR